MRVSGASDSRPAVAKFAFIIDFQRARPRAQIKRDDRDQRTRRAQSVGLASSVVVGIEEENGRAGRGVTRGNGGGRVVYAGDRYRKIMAGVGEKCHLEAFGLTKSLCCWPLKTLKNAESNIPQHWSRGHA